jgi:hypothetical protein
MARTRSNADTTVTPILRDDGIVYFHYENKTLGERVCQWTLALLWLLAGGVAVAALI